MARVRGCAKLPNSIQLSFFTLIYQLELNPIQDLMTLVFQSDQGNGSGMGWTLFISDSDCSSDLLFLENNHADTAHLNHPRGQTHLWNHGGSGVLSSQVNNSNHQTDPMAMIGSQWAPLVKKKLKSPSTQSPRMK